MKYLVKEEIVDRYFEEKYDGLYLLPYYEVKEPRESDYDFGHQDIFGGYMDIYRAAGMISNDLSWGTRGDDTTQLETCELLGKLMADAAENARLYWNNVVVANRNKRKEEQK